MDLRATEHDMTIARNRAMDDRAGVSRGHLDVAQRYITELTREVPLAIDWLQADRRNPLNKFAAVLRGIDPQVIALCALQHALGAIASGDDIGATDRLLGYSLAGEIVYALLDDENRKTITKQAKAQRGDMAAKIDFAHQAAKRLGIKKVGDALDPVTRRHAGAFLRSLLLSSLPDVFAITDDNTRLTLTDEAAPLVEGLVNTAMERNPVFLPMRTPPKPWTSLFGGGPVDGRQKAVPVMRTHAKQVKAAVKAACTPTLGVLNGPAVPPTCAMQPALDALNALQATPWRINKRVLGAIELAI